MTLQLINYLELVRYYRTLLRWKKTEKQVAKENMKTRFKVVYWSSWTLDARVGRWTMNAGRWTLDTGLWILNGGLRTLKILNFDLLKASETMQILGASHMSIFVSNAS